MQARQVDEAAFGVVYGSIMVTALLMGLHAPIEDSGRQALLLFGSVFVMAVAKAYAGICERMLQSGHAATWADASAVWSHSRAVLLAGNGPTLAFLLAALGLFSANIGLIVAQILVIGLLGWFGGRIGWRVGGTILAMFFGAALTRRLGLLITSLETSLH